MLILTTGVPGHGKTLFAVEKLLGHVKDNIKWKLLHDKGIHEEKGVPVPDPRAIYSDIDGLNIEDWEVLPAPDDWRDCPDGSIVFYDECQQKFGPDGQGRSARGDIQEFETHRHRGFDIYLITQHPKLLHAHIRRLIGRHYHVERQFGTQNAKIYQRDGQIDIDKSAQLTKLDNFIWSYPKKLYGSYKSATLHTHKAHMPKWIKRSLIGMVVAISILGFLIPKSLGFFTGDAVAANITGEPTIEHTVVSNDIVITPVSSTSPVACISMASNCACYNIDGFKLDIPFQFCKKFTEDTPRYLDIHPKRTRRAVAS